MSQKKKQIIESTQQLQQVARKFSRIEDLPIKIVKGVEISTREAHTIQAIGEHSALCVKDLAARFGVSKSAASQMVSKLVRKGFIDKRFSAHSNKELQLSLTPMGWQAFRAHEQSHVKDMNRIVEGMMHFSSTEIATLKKLLKMVSDIADERLGDG